MQDKKVKIAQNSIWIFSILILILYPLRHIGTGVDLWDSGYNYANFQYMGTEYMDSMWLFATWIANGIGALLMKLPMGDTVLGMNFYTGLLVSAMAIGGFVFCVKKIKMPVWLVLAGEVLALSLCWAPTAVLYSYLTYGLLLVGTVLLYQGLVQDRKGYLIAAGAVLGMNVGVRFSNLPQAGLIVALWVYGFLCHKKWSVILKETGFCILGYLGAFGSFLLWMSLRYGFGNYVEGIRRLFGMTEVATDYTPISMLLGTVRTYIESIYWFKHFSLMIAVGMAVCLVFPGKFQRIKKVLCIVAAVAVAWLLHERGFFIQDYGFYYAIYYPSAVILAMMMLLAGIQIFSKKTSKEEKLLAGLMVLTVFLSALGGNNAFYSSINNLFLVLPYFLWMVWRFCRERQHILYYPVKCMLLIGVLIFAVQALGFGRDFVYEEAGGGRNRDTVITEIPVLQGISTNAEKAGYLTELYRYLQQEQLGEREYILYGQIPGIAHYLELTPAMNIWADLLSYGYSTMEKDVAGIEEEIAQGGSLPVVILEASYGEYLEGNTELELFWEQTGEQKLFLIGTFMERYGYKKTFGNAKYMVYQAANR